MVRKNRNKNLVMGSRFELYDYGARMYYLQVGGMWWTAGG
jgi:hypothetical protein